MEANAVSIKSFMMADASTFYIPLFQRSYAWTSDNINRLMDDVSKVFSKEKKIIFLGNIIVSTKKGTNTFEIIDGQQRTITLFLMTLAARNILIDVNTVYSTWAANLIDEYLSSISYIDGKKIRKIKLKAKNQDERSLNDLFESEGRKPSKTKDDRINNNYELIKERLWDIYKMYDDPTKFFDAFFEVFIQGIQIVEIIIYDTDQINPQDVFETFNGTGVPLTNFDLIRNFMLMSNSENKQEQIWQLWEPLENKINKKYNNDENGINDLLINYINKKLNKSISSNDIYKEFKLAVLDSKDKKEVIADLDKLI